jgi:hypothetical protein
MEMPAPTDAAMPTRKVCQVLCVANAAANSGATGYFIRRGDGDHTAGRDPNSPPSTVFFP